MMSTRVHNEQPLAAANSVIGTLATQFQVYQISPSAQAALERAMGGITGATGPLGPTGPAGPVAGGAGGITGSVQYSMGDALGTLKGTSRFLYDGVDTLTVNGQTINGVAIGPSTGLFFNGSALIVSSGGQVYTSLNTMDDGSGNASIHGTLNGAGITGTTISATTAMFTPSLAVNGFNLVKATYCLAGVNNSGSGALNFGSIVFSTGGTFTVSGQTLTLPTFSGVRSYVVSLAGTGLVPVTTSSATLIINAPLASVNLLFLGSVNNASSSSQSLTTQSEYLLTVSANTSVVVSASTTIFTSFQGRVSVTQLV
jgi:hypothetical protein